MKVLMVIMMLNSAAGGTGTTIIEKEVANMDRCAVAATEFNDSVHEAGSNMLAYCIDENGNSYVDTKYIDAVAAN